MRLQRFSSRASLHLGFSLLHGLGLTALCLLVLRLPSCLGDVLRRGRERRARGRRALV